jgi:hypothetical protein
VVVAAALGILLEQAVQVVRVVVEMAVTLMVLVLRQLRVRQTLVVVVEVAEDLETILPLVDQVLSSFVTLIPIHLQHQPQALPLLQRLVVIAFTNGLHQVQ